MKVISIRQAKTEDAAAAIAVLRDSITQLCVADHRNEPATLGQWLRNKTTEQFLAWITRGDNWLIVAERELTLCGVGSLHKSGEIQLCYVQPGLQGTGVGKSLLTALEAQAKAWGIHRLFLRSTNNARAFYEHCGYVSAGESTCAFGSVKCFPYEKFMII